MACPAWDRHQAGRLQRKGLRTWGSLCTQVSRSGGSSSLRVGSLSSLLSCLPGAWPDAGPEGREGCRSPRSGGGCSSGLCPPALIGRVLAPSAPRKGGPRTATRKVRQPWTEARSPRLALAPRLWATPALSCPSCPQQSPEAWLRDVDGPSMLTRCDSKSEVPAVLARG